MTMLDKILNAIDKPGWTQQRLESLAGLSHGRISKWKAGKGEPSGAESLRIARALGVSVEWLLDDRAEGEPVEYAYRDYTDDERQIIDLFRAISLTRHEALRRLAGKAPAAKGRARSRGRKGKGP